MAGNVNADKMALPLRGRRLERSDAIFMGCVTPHEDCSGGEEDDAPEAWVAGESLDWSDDPADIRGPTPLANHEPEDWDAEMEADENPYDEDDVACEQQSSVDDYQWGSEESYQPSVDHAPPLQHSRSGHSLHIQAGQFEDAEQ
ncbi:coordinator of PRMT5 and differentiation stimulator [Bufo gargarizans]|uniref:coordinator of PRMT5 and differentiation stimulator n=1 Tax=Bufo gargarizans TaxID=30331 RepID=UPI001CF21DB2|nr:coordinator of PRMT5 and differentiation stimulator [Bufo gargarizans]